MDSLSRVLRQTLKNLDLEEAAVEARALILWAEIVGPQVAQATEAHAVRAGTLTVIVRNSGWGQELGFQKPFILKRYQERLGTPHVRDLRFQVGAVRGTTPPVTGPAPSDREVRKLRLSDEVAAEIRKAYEGMEAVDPELAQAVRRTLTHEAQLRQWHLVHGARACTACGAAHRTGEDLCPACRRDAAPR